MTIIIIFERERYKGMKNINNSLNKLIKLWFSKRKLCYYDNSYDVIKNQYDWLLKMINYSKNSEWGKEYGYDGIKNYNDYKNNVPLQTYDTLKPFIIRMMNGERNILWPSVIKWFAKSSGTTEDKSKFIPVSDESLKDCHIRGGLDMFSIYLKNHPSSNIFKGKGIGIVGNIHHSDTNRDIMYGDLSALLMKNLPLWVKMFNPVPEEVALSDNWDLKIDNIIRYTKNSNITNISGVPSWMLILIERIVDKTNANSLSDIWPNIELIIHGGVNFEPYKPRFSKIIGKQVNYINAYNASEGYFAFQDTDQNDDMLLLTNNGVFYEFIPMKDYNDVNSSSIVDLSGVNINENYAIVITTNAGLWRYIIGDTVRVTSISPYRIRITGRTRSFINAFGEELIVENTDNAIIKACSETGAVIREYTVAPIYIENGKSGAHEWLIEFEKRPENIDKFKIILDNSLKLYNSDYEAKRINNLVLSEPIIHVLKEGSFYEWLKYKKKLGGQHKIPRLKNDRAFIEELKAFFNL